eukprot:5792077-Pyramimonas_sp.AAC.1
MPPADAPEAAADGDAAGPGERKRSLDELEESERQQLFQAAQTSSAEFERLLGEMAAKRRKCS